MNLSETKAPFLYRLSGIICETQQIDQQTLLQARKVIGDTVGTAFSGVKTQAFLTAFSSKTVLFGVGEFPIWGTGETANISAAIFYNTLSISSTDFDEGHRSAVGHPASLVVPAAILLGQLYQKPFSEVLKAVIIGYEIGTRFSRSRQQKKINSYSTGRWGAIATAATAAYLLDLNPEQAIHALSNAAVLSPAMLGGSTDVSTGSMSKEGVAWAAQSGLQSAFMAKNGFLGPYLFVDEVDDYDNNKLVEKLGESWLINSNYFKPFACCRWLHPALQASVLLKKEQHFSMIDIEKIEVEIFSRALNLISSEYPINTVQAQFHLPYVLACSLIYDQVLPDYFRKNFLSDKTIKTLINKVKIKPNANYTDRFPQELQSSVTILLKNKKSIFKEIITAPWDFGNHPTADQLMKKFILQTGEDYQSVWNQIMNQNDSVLIF